MFSLCVVTFCVNLLNILSLTESNTLVTSWETEQECIQATVFEGCSFISSRLKSALIVFIDTGAAAQ